MSPSRCCTLGLGLWLSLLAPLVLSSTVAKQKVQPRPGIWQANCMSELWVIDGDRYRRYNITAISCVARDSGAVATLVGGVFPTVEQWTPQTAVVSGYGYRYRLHRLKAMPAACSAEHDLKDPLYNFDVFCRYFADNYVGFAVRKIDVPAMQARYRARLNPSSSEDSLYAVLGAMVEEIDDPHVFLSNGKHGQEEKSYGSPNAHGLAAALQRASPGLTTSEARAAARRVEDSLETAIRSQVLHGQFHLARRGRLLWGMLTPQVGYLRNSAAYGFFDASMTREQMYEALDATLDTVFTDLGQARSLVIDVTMNVGGARFILDSIARRVISKPVVAYRSRMRSPSGWTETFIQSLSPTRRPGFSGPVVVLISANTVSAGETLPLVLRGLPRVTIMGEPTLGAEGSFVTFGLPNGGEVGVSVEMLTTRDGTWFESRGIPPDVVARVFDPTRPVAGYSDFLLQAAHLAASKIETR